MIDPLAEAALVPAIVAWSVAAFPTATVILGPLAPGPDNDVAVVVGVSLQNPLLQTVPPERNNDSASPELSVSATWIGLPAAGKVNELWVAQQFTMSSVIPSAAPAGLTVNGGLTGWPPTGTGSDG